MSSLRHAIGLLMLLTLNVMQSVLASKVVPQGECLSLEHDSNKFHCVSTTNLLPCVDENENCIQWAKNGECTKNQAYMLFHCRKSCDTCVSLHHGTAQVIGSGEVVYDIVKLLTESQKYVYSLFAVNYVMFRTCVNKQPNCAILALQGDCNTNFDWMEQNCPAVCKSCT